MRIFKSTLFSFFTVLYFTASSTCLGSVRVAFLKKFDSNGRPVELETSGHGYFHIAVSYKGVWLHAFPRGGVQLSEELSEFGEVSAILESDVFEEPGDAFVHKVLGLPFDRFYSWDEDSSYYCSKLLAKVFDLKPTPMRFASQGWQDYIAYLRKKGFWSDTTVKKGLSPDEVYDQLVARGFRVRPLGGY